METKNCQNCKQDFEIFPEDFEFYKKIDVPPPTWCPQCRVMRRMLFRNERKLFPATEGISGKPFLSLWPPEAELTVYKDKDWWDRDLWDPLEFGQDFEQGRPFFSQLLELFKKVPKLGTNAVNLVNSDYAGNAADLKNCYLIFNSNYTEDCAYGNGVDFSRSCFDNSHIQKSERCYNSFWLTNCYETHFSVQCEDCASVWLSKNCRGCTDCFGCVNLRTKKYCIFNKEYSKEEYEQKIQEMRLNTYSGLMLAQRKAKDFWMQYPNKSIEGVQNTNVSGEYISHSKNVANSYLIRESEDLKYCQYSQVPSSRDCMDGSLIGNKAELFYEVCICGWGSSNMRFCWDCWDGGRELEYCIACSRSAANLFGCVGIADHQYCILNKQYSKEEYFSLRQKIIQHMNDVPYIDKQGRVYKYGEFFPLDFSPLAYQQTIVPEHFPMDRAEVEAAGMRWEEPNPKEYQTTMAAADIADSIEEVNDSILKEVIQCEECDRAYRIIQPEFQFLQQVRIPIPRICVDCRHYARISQRNRSTIYPRKCQCGGSQSVNGGYKNSQQHFHSNEPCPNEFQTSYAPERPEIVYCEQCYQKEVI